MRVRSGLAGDRVVPLKAKARRDGWTVRRRAKFLEVLKLSCNVTAAAESVRLSITGAYDLRRRDAAFAAEWKAALEQGYSELEMLLLRQSIHGSETTETLDDGLPDGRKRVKTVHSYPHATALRLLLAHRQSVDAYREEQGIERPGSDAVKAEIERRFAALRPDDDCDDERGQTEEGA
jgi:hypothetical protein